MPVQSLAALIASNNYSQLCLGSVPFTDPNLAARFFLERSQVLPFWPELPRRSRAELMLARSERASSGGWSGYTSEEASGLYAFTELLKRRQESLPLVKGQILGPVSCLLFLSHMAPSWSSSMARVSESCLKQIEFQAGALGAHAGRVLVVLDEPGLSSWNTFDAGVRKLVRECYSYLYVRCAERNVFLGLHACRRFDKDFLLFPFDLLSFDAVANEKEKLFNDQSAPLWKDALERGVVVAPGVYPAVCDGEIRETLKEGAIRRSTIEEVLASISFRAPGQILWSANCGHANATEEWVEALYLSNAGSQSLF